MDLATYSELRTLAGRCSARADEAEDLVQETLLAALQAGRSDLPWLAGVMRQQAVMIARTAVRRRQREANAQIDEADPTQIHTDEQTKATINELLSRLSPAARRVAVLALHGLAAEEIRWILDITPAAFRQRLTSIRKMLGELPADLRAEAMALAYLRDTARSVELQFGLVRRSLRAALADGQGLGTHDADGHLLVIRRTAHTFASGGNRQVIPDESDAV